MGDCSQEEPQKQQQQQRLHIVAFPFPIPGHINPLMYVCKRLADSGDLSITFAVNEETYPLALRTRGQPHPFLQVVKLDDGLDYAAKDGGAAKTTHPSENLERPALSARGMRQPLQELILRLQAVAGTAATAATAAAAATDGGAPPVAAILTDTFNGWVQDVADDLGLPRAVFWTSNAVNDILHLHLPQLMERGIVPVTACKPGAVVDFLPEQPVMQPTDLPFSFYYEHPILETVADGARRFSEAEFALSNTLEELEPDAVSTIRRCLKPNYYCVGPCIAPELLAAPLEGDAAIATAAGGTEEDRRCMEWLNKQQAASVLYVSFGSVATMSVEQVCELALGLEQSGKPFLLVLRRSLVAAAGGAAAALAEVAARVAATGRGLVVTWAPQMAVLRHVAVGGFLTHCGWNSVLEAMCAGVPMLAWPCMAEQNVNCRQMVVSWQVALQVADEEAEFVGGMVAARAVAQLVVRFMTPGGEGDRIRTRAAALRSAIAAAVAPGGSSSRALAAFSADVRRRWESGSRK